MKDEKCCLLSLVICWRVLQNWFVRNQENGKFLYAVNALHDLPWGEVAKKCCIAKSIRCTFACLIGEVFDPEKPRISRQVNVIWNYYFLFLYLILDFFSRKDNSATNRTEFILIVGRMYAEYFNGLEKKEAKSWKFVQSTDSIMRNS